MNLIFEINYATFSVFAALLITEVIGAVVLLLFYDVAKSKVLEYAVPIWEVTGTFGAFWVVTGDFAFPSLLIPLATIFGALLGIFLILFVGRNAAIAFAEFIIKKGWLDAKKLYKGYALSTLLLGVTVLILLSALISGAGVLDNASPLSTPFNLVAWASQLGSWLFLAGALLIGIGMAPVFFDIRPFANKFLPLAVLGVLLSIGAYYAYSPSLVSNYIAIPALLTVAAGLLYLPKRTATIVTNKAVFIAVVSIIIFSLQPLIYPNVIGQQIPIDSVTTTGPMAQAYLTITLIGGSLLAVMLLVYVWIAFRQKGTEAKQIVGKATLPGAHPNENSVMVGNPADRD